MSLQQWLRNGWLQPHDPAVAGNRAVVSSCGPGIVGFPCRRHQRRWKIRARLRCCVQLCMIPLRAAGCSVPKGGWHHKRAIESLTYTLGGTWKESAEYLDRCSRQRGQAMYERIDVVSMEDADDLLKKPASCE